jgi:predicted small metal-binding protein
VSLHQDGQRRLILINGVSECGQHAVRGAEAPSRALKTRLDVSFRSDPVRIDLDGWRIYHPRQAGLVFNLNMLGRCTMTKVLRCRDVGVDCDFVARGATVEELMEKAQQHARTDHGYETIPPELAEKAKAAIRDEESVTA